MKFILILLTITMLLIPPALANPPENKKSHCIKSELHSINDNKGLQTSQRYGCNYIKEKGFAYILTPVIIYIEESKEYLFFIEVVVFWADTRDPKQSFIIDQSGNILTQIDDDDWGVPMYYLSLMQWWHYYTNGFEADLSFEDETFIHVSIPKEVFRDIDSYHEEILH